jgi:hypothetical protein
MPITYGTFTKQMKLLPLTLDAGGGASVVVRFGYVGADEVFQPTTETVFTFDQATVSSILDTNPTPGLSRRDDLSFAIYSYLVNNNLIEPGTIS